MLVIFDKDDAGKKAHNELATFIKSENGADEKTMFLEPSNSIIKIYKREIDIPYEIEHLFSGVFFDKLYSRDLLQKRDSKELHKALEKKLSFDKSVSEIIDDLANIEDINKNIIIYNPRDDKKMQILDLLKQEMNQNEETDAFEGIENTIRKIEKYFRIK